MPKPIIDVFRFRHEPTAAFTYLGAVWTIEIRAALDGEHWECVTTAPLRMTLAMAEDRGTLLSQLLENGMAAVRHTQRWHLCAHLECLGVMERVVGSTPPLNVGLQ
jgi:hypothetical protein